MVCHDPARGLSATEVSPPTHTVDLSETTAPGGRPRTRVRAVERSGLQLSGVIDCRGGLLGCLCLLKEAMHSGLLQ